ncbi:MAG: hypothetical protein MJZ16_12820 [Bacteroidales bacterium]|nr:hypothetical protein [Bacteroidales bacterium]
MHILVVLVVMALPSCKAINNLIHDEDVVAKVGSSKLFRSELEAAIPSGISPEDSIAVASQYINSWASDQIYLQMAEMQLSKSEKDVSKELEEYRQSLLKYRYEQRYINERLDTVVTRKEINDYYNGHLDKFVLDAPIVKAKTLVIMKDSPNYETIRQDMSSTKAEDIAEADSLAYATAFMFTDWDGKWMDITTIAKEYGTDYVSLLSRMKDSYVEQEDESGRVIVTYIREMMKKGETAPEDYCSEWIRDIIISTRKHQLLTNLERELLDDAKAKESIVIY